MSIAYTVPDMTNQFIYLFYPPKKKTTTQKQNALGKIRHVKGEIRCSSSHIGCIGMTKKGKLNMDGWLAYETLG